MKISVEISSAELSLFPGGLEEFEREFREPLDSSAMTESGNLGSDDCLPAYELDIAISKQPETKDIQPGPFGRWY